MVRSFALAALLSACTFGGGPYVGYSKKGAVFGAEAGPGFAFVQTAVGLDSFGRLFTRLDFARDNTFASGDKAGTFTALRGGFGAVGSLTSEPVESHLALMFGAGIGEQFSDPHCQKHAITGAVELQLRLTDTVEIVLAPRLDSADDSCFE